MKWTARQERELVVMYDGDTPASVIAKQLGRTTRAIYKRASILGLTSPERSQNIAKAQHRDGPAIAYKRGQEHRARGRAKVCPSDLSPALRAWWFAGFHDKDMEMGFSVLGGAAL